MNSTKTEIILKWKAELSMKSKWCNALPSLIKDVLAHSAELKNVFSATKTAFQSKLGQRAWMSEQNAESIDA